MLRKDLDGKLRRHEQISRSGGETPGRTGAGMLLDVDAIARTARPEDAPAPSGVPPLDPPPLGGSPAEASETGEGGRQDGAARVAFRDGEAAGVLEIVSVDASGAVTVHKVAGMALFNLMVKAAECARRGAGA